MSTSLELRYLPPFKQQQGHLVGNFSHSHSCLHSAQIPRIQLRLERRSSTLSEKKVEWKGTQGAVTDVHPKRNLMVGLVSQAFLFSLELELSSKLMLDI
ncbi:hypothetical protein MHYP_G00058240 [Metynnis hypsauchen]